LRAFGRRKDDAVSDVLGTFLMLAITVMLTVVLFIMFTGQPSTVPENSTIVFRNGDLARNATNNSRNDTSFEVTTVLGTGAIIWNDSSFHVLVLDSAGSVMVQHNTTIFDTNGNGRVDSGDRLVLRGCTAAYHGLKVTVTFHNRVVSEVTIP
jgi:FlaG/FlaF family flagellin (archaellin)